MRIGVILKQQSKNNIPTTPTMAWTPISAPIPAGQIKLWISPLPKASGGFHHGSTASMGIVFLLLTMAKSTVGALSPPLLPLLFSPCSDLAGAEQRRDAREKAHAFTSASHTYKEKKSNCSDMHACAHAHTRMPAHRHIHTHVISFKEGQQWERVKRRKMGKSLAAGSKTPSVEELLTGIFFNITNHTKK